MSDWIEAEAQALTTELLDTALSWVTDSNIPVPGLTRDMVLSFLRAKQVASFSAQIRGGWQPKAGWRTAAARSATQIAPAPRRSQTPAPVYSPVEAPLGQLTDEEVDKLVWRLLLVEIPEDYLIKEGHVTRAQVRAAVPPNILSEIGL